MQLDIKEGADINERNEDGESVLDEVILGIYHHDKGPKIYRYEIIKFLLDNGPKFAR